MSTKTITKRVALATVVALGAGVLSLVSVSSANATTGNINVAPTSGATNPAALADVLNIASNISVTGSITAHSSTAIAASTTGTSLGLLAVSDIAGNKVSGTTQTATLLSSGTIQVYTSSSNGSLITVTGGTIGASDATSANAARTAVGINGTGSASDAVLWAQISPNSGAASMTISLYTGSGLTGANLVSGASSGTLTGQVVVTIAASSVSGTMAASKSAIFYEAAGAKTTSLTADDTTGTPGSSDWATTQYANIKVKDAYGVAVAAGLLQASATNGALVQIDSNGTTAATQSTAFYTSSPDSTILTVSAPTTAPVSTVVTVTYNGVVVGTKSFTFTGNVAKIVLSSASNGKTGSTGTVSIAFADSAGNAVYLQGTNTPAANFLADSGSYNGVLTNTSLSTAPSNSTTPGVATFTCGTNNGSANLDVKYVNNDGTTITSNALAVTCSGDAVSYTAKYDKSTYNLGDIAVLIVTFKDSKGALANDKTSNTAAAAVITNSGLGTVVTAPATADASTNGVIKYSWPVGNSAQSTGTFTNSVDFATVDTRATNAGLSQTAVTASFTVSNSGTSLNDVLKGIVSLIASINKQIAALAKLVTKK